MLWSISEQVCVQMIRFILSMIMARLLLPADFGLVAMLGIFVAIADSIVDSGFGSALVQRKDLTHKDKCSVFYLNLALGAAMAAVLWLAAPWMASFFLAPRLIDITRAYSFVLIISSFGIVQRSLLTRDIEFRTLAKTAIWSTLLSGVLGVVMAVYGCGVWSLVAQAILRSLIGQALLWGMSSWRPSFEFSWPSLRPLFSFGSKVFAAGVIDTVFRNVYPLVIGILFSPSDLGYYGRAQSTQQMPTLTLSKAVRRVTFSVFSAMSEDKQRLQKSMRRIVTMMVFINFPIMIGIIVTARPLVIVLFTEKWAASIPYLQLLGLVGLLYPLQAINLNALLSQGHSGLFLQISIVKKSIVVLAIVLTYRYGIHGLICGQIAHSWINYFINSYYTGKLLGYTPKSQLMDCFPYLISSLIMGVIVYGLQFAQFPSLALLLVSQICTGVVVYAGVCWCLRLSAWREAQTIVVDYLRSWRAGRALA